MKRALLIVFFLSVSFVNLNGFAQANAPVATGDSVKNPAQFVAKLDSVLTAQKKLTAAQTASAQTDKVICQPAGGVHQIVGWAFIALLIVFFVVIAVKSNLLRVAITDPKAFMVAAHATVKYRNEHDINKIPKPFSLSRSQLGIWTLVIGCSYIYLELCKFVPTTQLPIDSTLLALMGISAGTAAASNVIDNNTTTEQQGLQSPSGGFFSDILSDQNGINIHRFQNVVWTLIAVTLYIAQIPHLICGQLPALDGTLIALTGISSATYLGLKINENKPPALPPPPSTEADLPPSPPVTPPPAPVTPPPAPVQPVVPVQPIPVVVTNPPAPVVTPVLPTNTTPPAAPATPAV